MEKNKKCVIKTFLVHQYEKEEEFLSRMGKEGWHFVKLHIGIPSKYEFVKGEKTDHTCINKTYICP
jgi:nuclear transport factor 2 (NTF2) superfamily protein